MDVTLFIDTANEGFPWWATALIALGVTTVASGAGFLVTKVMKTALHDEWKAAIVFAPLVVGVFTGMVAHSIESQEHNDAYYGHATETLIEAADATYGVQLSQEHAETLVHSAREDPAEASVERFESVEVMNPTTDAPATIQLAWFGDEWVLLDDDGDELPSAGTSWE